MSITNSNITAELISDFGAGRLDAEDTQIVQEGINHDQVIATAAADARQTGSRTNLWRATPAVGARPRSLAGCKRRSSHADAFA
jgi:hypothetical protein